MKKPPIISLDEVQDWVRQHRREVVGFGAFTIKGKEYQEAQLDDTYEKMLAEVCEEIEKEENHLSAQGYAYYCVEDFRQKILARFKGG